jgi:hypothetical protein
MKVMQLNELLELMDEKLNHQYAEDLHVIKQAIAKGQTVTKFVQRKLEQEKLQLDRYAVTNTPSLNEYVVTSILNNTVKPMQRTVFFNLGRVAECSCSTSLNMKMPCRHVAATLVFMNSTENNLPKVQFIEALAPRWKLSNNPLYRTFSAATVPSQQPTTNMNEGQITSADLMTIKYPSKRPIRLSKLSDICSSVIEEGANSEYAFRTVMAYLSKSANGILDFLKSDGKGDCMDFISKAPCFQSAAKQNDRNTSIINHANRLITLPKATTKRKRTTPCSACQFYQNTTVTNHREYTKQCPQRDNPNHIKKPKEAQQAKENADILSQKALSSNP